MPPTLETTLMFMHCLTAMHPGSGTAPGVVDLPIRRERHTDWPMVPGSTLKGVLRAAARAQDEEFTQTAFGPETRDASVHAGALSVSDARILAFPVRSLKGVFAWTTCPALLDRLGRDLCVAQGGIDGFPQQPPQLKMERNGVLCQEDSPLLIEGEAMLLEEFDFERAGNVAGAADFVRGVADWIAENAVADAATAARLRSHLAILPDDAFGHFARHATEISARIGLDEETRTVKDGALFWEEHLPPETLFYALVTSHDSRRRDKPAKAGDILRRVREAMPKTLQVGGNATLGKGLCNIGFMPSDGRRPQ